MLRQIESVEGDAKWTYHKEQDFVAIIFLKILFEYKNRPSYR